MGIVISRQIPKNEYQPSQTLKPKDQGNTARQHDKHENRDATGTARHVTDALPTEHPHGMQAMSTEHPHGMQTMPTEHPHGMQDMSTEHPHGMQAMSTEHPHGTQAMSNSSTNGTTPSSNSSPMPVMTRKEFESVVYSMNHDNRGMAIIINNKTFKPYLNLTVRTGTDVDGMALHSTFNAMGFDVKIYNDRTVKDMMAILSDASKKYDYHRNSDCFVCAILTHGEEQDVLYGTDGKADFKNILSFFKGKDCPGLVGKPKLFFIQVNCTSYDTTSHLMVVDD
ncbi:hypothetical protein CHS0354_033268 [Potamilus streckersoni]|uniref:Caspase family p20 domain-containing protein n=1 Tax=Potamilus streckersoni TaxID=2493646 RepID=A0AAE0S6N1_9BIVA|nr:hypothetical protein CHS0354_033268 [Potamilus streckersoni]